MRLDHADFQRFNGEVAMMYLTAFTEGPLPAIVQVLTKTIGGNVVCVSLNGTNKNEFATTPGIENIPVVEVYEALKLHPRVTNKVNDQVVKISDFSNRKSWSKNGLYQVSLPFVRMEDDLSVNLKMHNGNILQACVIRDSRTFKEEDRTIFSLLLPHFYALLSCMPVLNSQPSSLEGLGLTRREQEILFWVAEGKTNAEAADILNISPHTVRTHLEHIYPKLGVENRHGATRRALERLKPR